RSPAGASSSGLRGEGVVPSVCVGDVNSALATISRPRSNAANGQARGLVGGSSQGEEEPRTVRRGVARTADGCPGRGATGGGERPPPHSEAALSPLAASPPGQPSAVRATHEFSKAID